LADAGTKRLAVIDDLGARQRFPPADGGPDIHAIERCILTQPAAGKLKERRVQIDDFLSGRIGRENSVPVRAI
jgi:hypothetical protein